MTGGFDHRAEVAMLGRFLALLLIPVAAAEAQTACGAVSARNVGASGTATIAVRPDRVSFTLGVETTAATVAEAMAGNNSKLKEVIAALKAKGVKPQEIQTSQFGIDSSRDDAGRKTSGFRVSNLVSITREDPAEAGALLQAAVDAGANQAGAFRLFVADPSKHRDRGLELAFQDARAKAAKLATLSDGSLGAVLCVAEGGYSTSGYGGARQLIAVSAESPAIEAGVEEISFSIYAVFELR
jgi:uncharacterized protein YggE